MRVLIACEFSGIVRDAFIARGHEAISCDLLPTERPWAAHYRGDVREILNDHWDLMIAHPPCTYLTVSNNAQAWARGKETAQALQFVRELLYCSIPKIALENPIGVISSRIRKPDQIIQPWQFGHGEVKATCFWLKNLPLLTPTKIVWGREPRVHHANPGKHRWKERSRTLQGIADAMAEQWGFC